MSNAALITELKKECAARGWGFEDLRSTLLKSADENWQYGRRPLSAILGYAYHHAEAPRSRTWPSVAIFHVVTRGWAGIAYHIGIRLYDGKITISLLNDLETVSAHAGAEGNWSHAAICVMGDFRTSFADPLEIEASQVAVLCMDRALGRRPGIVPHSALRNTACPSNLKLVIPQLRPVAPPAPRPILPETVHQEVIRQTCIEMAPDAALPKRIFLDGFAPTSKEIHGEGFVAMRAARAGARSRTYYAMIGYWDPKDVYWMED